MLKNIVICDEKIKIMSLKKNSLKIVNQEIFGKN